MTRRLRRFSGADAARFALGDAPRVPDTALAFDRRVRACDRRGAHRAQRGPAAARCARELSRRGSTRSQRRKRYILFESYIIADDARRAASSSTRLASEGEGGRARVRGLRLAGLDEVRQALWEPLRAAGAEVHCFNPPSFDEPACVAHARPSQVDRGRWRHRFRQRPVRERRVGRQSAPSACEPWRDTGIEIRGPAVADIEAAFGAGVARVRRRRHASVPSRPPMRAPPGDMRVRVIAGVPESAGTYRTRSRCVASLAREHLWLTDAYFVGHVRVYAGAARRGDATASTCACWCRARATFPRCRRCRALAIGRCSRPACASSSGTARCCTPRPPWPTASGRASARPTSTSRAGCPTTSSTSRSRTRRSRTRWRRSTKRTSATPPRSCYDAQSRARPKARDGGERTGDGGRARAMSGSAGRAAAGAVSVGSALGAALTNRRTLGPAEAGLLVHDGDSGRSASRRGGACGRASIAWPLAIIGAWLGDVVAA